MYVLLSVAIAGSSRLLRAQGSCIVLASRPRRCPRSGLSYRLVNNELYPDSRQVYQPREALSSHGSELNTVGQTGQYNSHRFMALQSNAPQKPVSRPTAKQLASLLNEADNALGPADSSMTGRVFILYGPEHFVHGAKEKAMMIENETLSLRRSAGTVRTPCCKDGSDRGQVRVRQHERWLCLSQ